MAVPQEVNTRFFNRMKNQGLQFKNVVDIGCYMGAWTTRVKEVYPDANYYLIDANDKFKEELEKLGTFHSLVKNTKRLSEVLPKDIDMDFIKMDVQGAELEIIEGSLDVFMRTKFVQLECPVHPNNKGAPLFEHYINYMANCNFKVFDINTIFYNGKLMAVDFIFVNKNLPKVTNLEQEEITYNI
jgi:hypothetical protein